jgi:hypothetical protein
MTQRNAVMVVCGGNEVMFSRHSRMDSHTLPSIVHFDLTATIAHSHRLSDVEPRYRVSVAFPRHIGITRHFAQLFFHVWIRWTSSYRVELRLFFGPSPIDVFVDRSMGALIA